MILYVSVRVPSVKQHADVYALFLLYKIVHFEICYIRCGLVFIAHSQKERKGDKPSAKEKSWGG